MCCRIFFYELYGGEIFLFDIQVSSSLCVRDWQIDCFLKAKNSFRHPLKMSSSCERIIRRFYTPETSNLLVSLEEANFDGYDNTNNILYSFSCLMYRHCTWKNCFQSLKKMWKEQHPLFLDTLHLFTNIIANFIIHFYPKRSKNNSKKSFFSLFNLLITNIFH